MILESCKDEDQNLDLSAYDIYHLPILHTNWPQLSWEVWLWLQLCIILGKESENEPSNKISFTAGWIYPGCISNFVICKFHFHFGDCQLRCNNGSKYNEIVHIFSHIVGIF
jgi:hypothetical protein